MDLSAIDVQQKTFRERFRGYDPDDVEDFLDRVVETLRGQELKLQQQQEQLDGLSQDLAGTKEAEEAIKRTYITAQRTSQEMVNEAQEKAQAVLDEAKAEAETLSSDARSEADTLVGDARSEADTMVTGARSEADTLVGDARSEADTMVTEARADTKKTREEAAVEHEALQRRVAQLRTAVSDLQNRLQAFAETASVELEGLGASIDLETHSISEILEKAAADDEAVDITESAADDEWDEEPTEESAEEVADEVETAVADGADEAREAAYLQQPRGQRPWERA